MLRILPVLLILGCDLSGSPQGAGDHVVGTWMTTVTREDIGEGTVKVIEMPEVWDIMADGSFHLHFLDHKNQCITSIGTWETDKDSIFIELSYESRSFRYTLKEGVLTTFKEGEKQVWESWKPTKEAPVALMAFYEQGFCGSDEPVEE